MEDEKGKNVDAENNIKTKDSHTEDSHTKDNHAKNNPLALILAIIALILGSGGLVFGWMAYEKTAKPITFLNSGTDGNSANFTEGSIADIANKVSESVVSIITSTKTTNLFGQSYDSAAAGTGVIVTSDGYILTNKEQ